MFTEEIKNFTLKLISEKLESIVKGYSGAYKGSSNYLHFTKELIAGKGGAVSLISKYFRGKCA